MRRTFAHHENHIITLGSALTRLHVRNVTARSSWRGCAKSTFSLEKSPSLKKTTEIGKLAAIKPGEIAAMVQCRVSFFKDLVSSDGHPSSCLQQSIEISGAENVTSAVEEAKRHYERLRRVPIWSLCADRLELESEGKRTSYRPTHDESALIPIPGAAKPSQTLQSGVDRNVTDVACRGDKLSRSTASPFVALLIESR
jgi:hypothetical protein